MRNLKTIATDLSAVAESLQQTRNREAHSMALLICDLVEALREYARPMTVEEAREAADDLVSMAETLGWFAAANGYGAVIGPVLNELVDAAESMRGLADVNCPTVGAA